MCGACIAGPPDDSLLSWVEVAAVIVGVIRVPRCRLMGPPVFKHMGLGERAERLGA